MDLVTGAMGALPAMVLQLLNEEYQLQTGVKDNVKFLSKELESMHANLSMVALVPPEKLDARAKLWARDFREASYDMEDILDTFLVRVDGGPKPAVVPGRVRRLLSMMAELFCLGKVVARHEIATTILGFIKELKDMDERHGRCRVDHLAAAIPDAAEASIDPRISAFYREASELVGIDEPRDAVIDMLDDSSSKKMKVVSIFGSGGLGKTTLAKAAYHKVNLQFDCWASVSVGQNPDQKKVLRDILIDLFDNEAAKEETTDHDKNAIIHQDKKRYTVADLTVLDAVQLMKQLREFLRGKRYLIVIDDIWDTDTWEVIMKPAFVESNCGSRIIATTRMSDVAETIGEPYEIQQLSDDCSRKLLSKIIFGREDELENDKLAEKIIHKCHGVPLAITSIASLLAPPKQRHEWSNVYESIFLNSIGSESDKNPQVDNAMKILSFSYYHLPCHLRTCMLYLSVFPEDEYVDKNMLIWRWIAEGLVRKEEGKELFEVGDRYFRELLNRGLIQPSKDGGILGGCRVHDFVLRLIRRLSREDNFVSVVDSEQMSLSLPDGKVRRLALQNVSDMEDSRLVKVDDIDMSVARSFNAMYTNKVPPVADFELLRVLALEYCWVEDGYLNLIGKLRHLRYLGLTGTPTRKLPDEVGDLKFLQTLMLHETGIEELPKSLEHRKQLMCLRGDEKTRVPKWIGKLTSLVELQIYPGAEGKCFVEELGKLKHIRVLKTQINLQDEGEARDLLESLSKLQRAESIVVVSTMGVIRLSEDAMQRNLVLNCKNVSVLELRALIFPRLPACINAQDLPKLNKLYLCVGVLEQQDMEILGKFEQLHDLSISGPVPDGVDSIVIGGGVGFQNLSTLTSSANIKFAAGAMPRLQTIKLWLNAYDVLNVENHVLNLGLGNIYSLQQVTAIIVCSNCFPAEVEEMEHAVKDAVNMHPNWPTLSIMRYDEDGMATTDSGLLDRWKIKELEMGIRLIKQVNLHTRLLTEVADKLVYHDDSMAMPHPDGNLMKKKLQDFQDKSWDRFETEIYGEILWYNKEIHSHHRDYRKERDRFWDQYRAKIHNNLLWFEPNRDVHRVKENILAMENTLDFFTAETNRLAISWERLKAELRLPAEYGQSVKLELEGAETREVPAVTLPDGKGEPVHLLNRVRFNDDDEKPSWGRFSDDEKPPSTNTGSIKGLVTMKPLSCTKDDAALTADTVTAELELNATSSTKVREGLDLVAVLDVSDRMCGKKMQCMKEAMLLVIATLTPVDRLSIVTFSDVATRPSPLRSMTPAAKQDISGLVYRLQQADGGPNIQAGLETGLAVIADRRHTKARTADIFLLSDGHQASGDARQVDPAGHVAIYTFGFGRGTEHKLMSDIAKKSPFGTYRSAHTRSFRQLLPGLLMVVAQDVGLTITPNPGWYFDGKKQDEVDAVEVARATNYTTITDSASGVININFGRLSAGERRKVVFTLTLKDVSATEVEEYDATLAEVQHFFTAQGRPKERQVPQDIQILRTETPSPDIRRWQLEDEFDWRRLDAIRQATVLADGKDEAQDHDQLALNRLRAELLKLTAHAYTQDPTPATSSKPKTWRRPHRGGGVR